MTPQLLRDILYVHKEGEVYVDHVTGPWIAKLCEAGLVKIVSSTGPIKCLVAKPSELGEAIAVGVLEVSQKIVEGWE